MTLQWGVATAINFGDFEGAEQGGDGAINNRTSKTSVQNWKSTGSSTPLYFHARPLAGLPWADLCGVVEAATRQADMQGNVLDAGVDPTESIGIGTIDAYRSNFYGAISPAIDLTTTSSPNAQGITSDRVSPTDDYLLWFDVYSGDFNAIDPTVGTGVLYWPGAMSYPNKEINGTTCWGDVCTGGSIYYQPDPLLYHDWYPMKNKNMIFTSNASGAPDSLRFFIGLYNHPARFGSTIGANPTLGAYFDNVSLGLVNKAGGTGNVGSVSSDIWQQFCDAFPIASFTGTSTAFATLSDLDTCGAYIKGAINNAQSSAAAGLGGNRLIILADSIMTNAADRTTTGVDDTNSTKVRLDMVFRILPGPGNYRQTVADSVPRYPGIQGMHLLRRPDVRTGGSELVNPSDAADHSFWASYMRNPGQFGAGGHHGGVWWDYLSWNSARMDTQEVNLFGRAPVAGGFYVSTLHEQDPHYAELAIAHPRCFIIDTLLTATSSNNVVCGTAPAWLTFANAARKGWDSLTTTKEMTKIIPDGLLTPGSHVEYFLRKSQIFGFAGYAMCPDTEAISNQPSSANGDLNRWFEFSILPDRYKAAEYKGAGDASLLYADYCDRWGDEGVWVSCMDSIGGTAANKYGAHNGWHAAPGVRLSSTGNANLAAQAFVYNQNASPGTLWDMYTARATESGSSVGTRLGGRNTSAVGADLLQDKDAKVAPSSFMLKSFYRAIALFAGPLNSTDLGPAIDMPENDLVTLADFLTSNDGVVANNPNATAGSTRPRAIYFSGQGFANSESSDPAHATFLSGYPGVTLTNASYSTLASNTRSCADLTNTSVITPTTADVYGVGLSCFYNQNVIGSVLGKSTVVSNYENTGHGPYPAAVYHAAVPSNDSENYITLTDAFDLQTMWGRYCSTSFGRLARTYNVMTHIFGQVSSKWASPGAALNVPNAGNGGQFANFMKIGNSVMRAGNANVRFGVANTGRVRVRLYDVTGRLVRTLADKTFQGGQEYSVDLGRS